MTIIDVTASMCASASDVALLVASFMPFPPWTGHDSPLRKYTRDGGWNFTRNTPLRRPLRESPLGVDRQFPRSFGNAAPIGPAYVAPASECR